jgi:hypothetical protein
MARANRHYLAGQIWHLTHRCHHRQFLLKLARDRQAWIDWFFEARKRFGLCVLDYRVTSNHIHLLVYDREGRNVIPDSLHGKIQHPKTRYRIIDDEQLSTLSTLFHKFADIFR